MRPGKRPDSASPRRDHSRWWEEDRGTSFDVERQKNRYEAGSDQLDKDARAVDRRHQPHAERVHDRGEHDQDRAEDHRVGGEIVSAIAITDDLKAAPQPRQVELQCQYHGRQSHNRRSEHQPARRPADDAAAE